MLEFVQKYILSNVTEVTVNQYLEDVKSENDEKRLRAHYYLGVAYLLGHKVNKDITKGLDYLAECVVAGKHYCGIAKSLLFNVSKFHNGETSFSSGMFIPIDPKECLKKAIIAHAIILNAPKDALFIYNLTVLVRNLVSAAVTRNYAPALYFSANHALEPAKVPTYKLEAIKQRYPEGLTYASVPTKKAMYVKEASSLGYSPAMLEMARKEIDPQKQYALYSKIVEQYDFTEVEPLLRALSEGNGVEKDEEKANYYRQMKLDYEAAFKTTAAVAPAASQVHFSTMLVTPPTFSEMTQTKGGKQKTTLHQTHTITPPVTAVIDKAPPLTQPPIMLQTINPLAQQPNLSKLEEMIKNQNEVIQALKTEFATLNTEMACLKKRSLQMELTMQESENVALLMNFSQSANKENVNNNNVNNQTSKKRKLMSKN